MWNAILQLKREGFREFDVGGFDPDDAASGISHFKGGINPVPYRYCDEIDAQSNRWLKPVIRRAIGLGRIPIKLPVRLGSLVGAGSSPNVADRHPSGGSVTASATESGRPRTGMRSRTSS